MGFYFKHDIVKWQEMWNELHSNKTCGRLCKTESLSTDNSDTMTISDRMQVVSTPNFVYFSFLDLPQGLESADEATYISGKS